MQKKFDIEAQLFMYILRLKEEKNKEYSIDECNHHIAYKFEDYEEFRNYFINNGCTRAYYDDFLSVCKMKTTKKGSIIALKGLCDYAITRSMESSSEFDICDKLEGKSKSRVLKIDNI